MYVYMAYLSVVSPCLPNSCSLDHRGPIVQFTHTRDSLSSRDRDGGRDRGFVREREMGEPREYGRRDGDRSPPRDRRDDRREYGADRQRDRNGGRDRRRSEEGRRGRKKSTKSTILRKDGPMPPELPSKTLMLRGLGEKTRKVTV